MEGWFNFVLNFKFVFFIYKLLMFVVMWYNKGINYKLNRKLKYCSIEINYWIYEILNGIWKKVIKINFRYMFLKFNNNVFLEENNFLVVKNIN